MLKLEKGALNQSISVSLRHEEPVFSDRFIQAFAIAFFLHLSGLFLFNVHLIHREDIRRGLEIPRIVDSDLGYSNHIDSSTIQSQAVSKHHYYPHALVHIVTTPSIPSFAGIVDSYFPLEEELIAYEIPQKHVERLPYHPQEVLFCFDEKKKECNVSISGPLAEKKMVQNGWKEHMISDACNGVIKLTYQVRVSNRTGKIIWYSKEGDPSHQQKEKIALEMLEEMVFEKEECSVEEPTITAGSIEVTFD